MTFPDPASVLRHRPPAVLVDAVLEFSGDRLVCSSRDRGPWPWPRLLEGAAQTAGLLAGAQAGGLSDRAVIADYRAVRIGAKAPDGLVRFTASIDRHVMQFWRCRVDARTPDNLLLLDGLVTLAPFGPETA
jgi:hypothetical protein